MTDIPPPTKPLAPLGAAVIRGYLKDMPTGPGVYRMLDAKGAPLYIGKARNLRARVSNYAQSAAQHGVRIRRMIAHTASMEIITTRSEAEALLLEANMVKKLQPRYNILLRDDKSYPYILLPSEHPFPRIAKHRGPRSAKGEYYGPFASAGAVNQTIAVLQRAFLLRPCPDTVFRNRTRPCLQYQIKRCSAPCVRLIAEEDYAKLIAQAKRFLTGKSREIQDEMAGQMNAAAAAMDYESAANYRDRIKALTQVQQEQGMAASGLGEADVVVLARAPGVVCIQVFFFRNNQNYGNLPYFPAHAGDATDGEVMAAFLGQFYQNREIPKQIVVSHLPEEAELLAEALGENAGRVIDIIEPQRGDKQKVVAQALRNAQNSLERRVAETMAQGHLLQGVAKLFALPQPPRRIEVYDNSHISGTNAVGAMIVAGAEGFNKKAYRTYNIKNTELAPGDDYGMMKEMLCRRLARLLKEDPDRQSDQWPDLILIDGGQGQLSAACEVRSDLGLGQTDLPLVAIAKGPDRNAGREDFYLPGAQPFTLPPNDPVLHYLQRLRDEAHRFAIGTHRNKRSRSQFVNTLDEVQGIGPTRKKALLQHFGSAKAVGRATLEELEKVPGIDKKVAAVVYGHFHG